MHSDATTTQSYIGLAAAAVLVIAMLGAYFMPTIRRRWRRYRHERKARRSREQG